MSHDMMRPLPGEDLLPDPTDPTALDADEYADVDHDDNEGMHDHDNVPEPQPQALPDHHPDLVNAGVMEDASVEATAVAEALVDYAVPALQVARPASLMAPSSALLEEDVGYVGLGAPDDQVDMAKSQGATLQDALPASTDYKTRNGKSSSSICIDLDDVPTTAIMEGAIWVPNSGDVLSGRGAKVNSHVGNKNFRALCFARKALFDAANPAAKQRIATEIWSTCVSQYQARYLKRYQGKGPWFVEPFQQAVLKAAQVMRDYRRPDRLLSRDVASSKKRSHPSATPLDNVQFLPPPDEPLVENPVGVNDTDVLCGRGAFANGHAGNKRLRELGLARKEDFDGGTFAEKRALATEIVAIIHGLDPPGRFLCKAKSTQPIGMDGNGYARGPGPAAGAGFDWEELDQEQAIHKACQVMRDIAREDRKEREERRVVRQQRQEQLREKLGLGPAKQVFAAEAEGEMEDSEPVDADVEDLVAAIEEQSNGVAIV